jgi:hypothetical protein
MERKMKQAKKAAAKAKSAAAAEEQPAFRRFTALEDFYSEETRSQYVKDLGYTANNPELEKLAEKWVREGKVRWGGSQNPLQEGLQSGSARVSGAAKVE